MDMDITTDASYEESAVDGPVLFTTLNGNKVTLASLGFTLMNVSPQKYIGAFTPQTCTLPDSQIFTDICCSAVNKTDLSF